MGKSKKNYYLGLDIGTDSVGWAVTDESYSLLKFHGEPAWGTHIFDEASLCDERRLFRTSRRRLDRKQQRVHFLQDLLAEEIAKKDEKFFKRIQESRLFREEVGYQSTLFDDPEFCDKDYYDAYPTIHHLIKELMETKEEHDIRLVYLALSWLVSHRGHFLSNISVGNLADVKDFSKVYEGFLSYFIDNGYELPWENVDVKRLEDVLKLKQNVTNKTKGLIEILFNGVKPKDEITEAFPFRRTKIVSLLAGGKVLPNDLFGSEAYSDVKSVSLSMNDEDFTEIVDAIGDEADLLIKLRAIYDWTLLVETLGDETTISSAKVQIYNQHKDDLAQLKYFVKKYIPEEYNSIFRDKEKDNYIAYTLHIDGKDLTGLKKTNKSDFSKFLQKKLNGITPDNLDACAFEEMMERIRLDQFLPKQKTTDNRVIPYQLYYYELIKILENAEHYLPFLSVVDETGLSVTEKIKTIFTFRIPYFVGPTNNNSPYAWLVRSAEKIYPWNFGRVVDLDASEMNFIDRMTNTCTYYPGENVIPKESLLYHKFTVLNEINNIKISGQELPIEIKQALYNDLFLNKKKITKKIIAEYFISNNVIRKGEEDSISGIDTVVNANLSTNIAFKKLLESKTLSQADVERIIERSTYSEDKKRLEKWIIDSYPNLITEDVKYICRLKLKDFGRFSKKFLTELEGVDKETGAVYTIINALWETNNNLMELLSDRFTFREELERITKEYYSDHPVSLEERLTEMRLSGAVKRSVYRTLDVVKDVEKAFGVPERIFVEVTRGAEPSQRGKRTKSRREQILELYDKCRNEDVRELRKQIEGMGDYADNRLQGDKLFLYYMQLGKCMYTGEPIDIEQLGTKLYDVDHIYPQAFVKDDSILNNKVLVRSEENGAKSNKYPIDVAIREKMHGFWKHLLDQKLITEEKYKRLTRTTPFTDDEKMGFISRQLVETSQSTKAVATLLKEKYPSTEIVYSKASLTSDFRQEFGLLKCRSFNDLHHAADAYLNIVTGNVYHMRFSKRWFNLHSEYSIKTKTLFTRPLICGGKTIWEGEESIKKVKSIAVKNNAHFTKFAYFKHGGLFYQMPDAAAEGLVPLKKGMDTGKYGGYNGSGIMFFIPISYYIGKKKEIMILSVELLHGMRFLKDDVFAMQYAKSRAESILGKKIDRIEFPMGMRPWKVNTVLSMDGFKISITGTKTKGTQFIIQSMMQFSESNEWKLYIKRLEKINEKKSLYSNYVIDEEYDKVSKQKNKELYNVYINKYKNTIWKKRENSPIGILEKGGDAFDKLEIWDQIQVLLRIQGTLGRTAGGFDLTQIGGGKGAAATSISAYVTNWKKKYRDVHIIDQSVTGLWEIKSGNLLELL